MPGQTRIESDLRTIGEVLQADFTYRVPPHQRNFSWRLEEVEELWDDITEAMRDGRPEYFLGTIVVTENRDDKTRTVIDGQQRLAVLSMILGGIRSVYREEDDDREGEVFQRYLGARDMRTRLTESRLTLNRTNEAIFQRLVVEHAPMAALAEAKADRNIEPSSLLSVNAAALIREKINERCKAEKRYETFLLDLEDFVKDRVVVILVVAGDDADAYLIFETLNDRGLDLSISDLLKNYIYGRAGARRLALVQKQWEEMILLLAGEDATQFLRHYWLSHYGVVRERDLYRALKRKFATAQQVVGLITDLRDAADKYGAMSNVDNPIWKGYPTQSRRDLGALRLFKLTQFRPLLLAVLDCMEEVEVQKVLRILVVLSMRYSIIGSLGTGNIEKAYSDAAMKVRRKSADTAAKVFGMLKGIYPNDDRFKTDFASAEIRPRRLARHILAAVANAEQPEQELEVVEDERKVTLEHIMPTTRSGDWSNAAADEGEYRGYVYRLGNLTLIEREANKEAGNAPFDQKKKGAFSTSNITITKDLCDYEKWTVEEIAERQRKLANAAVKVWSLSY
jgi:hypothetical protein